MSSYYASSSRNYQTSSNRRQNTTHFNEESKIDLAALSFAAGVTPQSSISDLFKMGFSLDLSGSEIPGIPWGSDDFFKHALSKGIAKALFSGEAISSSEKEILKDIIYRFSIDQNKHFPFKYNNHITHYSKSALYELLGINVPQDDDTYRRIHGVQVYQHLWNH